METFTSTFNDEWDGFTSFTESFEPTHDNPSNCKHSDNQVGSLVSSFKSNEEMESLVHKFEESLASCFRAEFHGGDQQGYGNEEVVTLEESPLSIGSVWKHVMDNYGLVEPLCWETSQMKKLSVSSLQLPLKHSGNNGDVETDLDDPELASTMNFHQIFEENAGESAVFFTRSLETDDTVMQTADEVIREIEEIMQDADEVNAAVDRALQDETGIFISDLPDEDKQPLQLEHRPSLSSPSSQDESNLACELKFLSQSELNAMCQGLENEVKELSAELLHELHVRDEKQFENEIKNAFISSVLEVQYKQEQFRKGNEKVQKSKTIGQLSVSSSGRYLTTIIPCNKNTSLSVDNLQTLIKLLNAIKADSEEVPSLLTAYILKVLCPAPVGQLSPSFGL